MKRRTAPRVAALLAALVSTFVIPHAVAQANPRTNCRDLEERRESLHKDDGDADLRRDFTPTDVDLEQAMRAVEKAQARLDELERQRKAAHDTLEVALARSPSQPTEINAAKGTFDAAVRDRDSALAELERKKKDFACTELAYDDARTFTHGLALGLTAARAADDSQYFGASLRYVHPYGPSRSLELALELNSFERGDPTRREERDERQALLALIPRFSFGTSGAAFVVGGGFGWLWHDEEPVAVGELGIDFRVNYQCGTEGKSCVGPWLNVKPFVQPLLPFDGSPVAFLFGVQVGGGVRCDRVGP